MTTESTVKRAPLPSAQAKLRTLADVTSGLASFACALHCLLVPVLLVSGTVLPVGFFLDEGFHLAMLWLVLPAGVVAFALGCWKHKDQLVLGLGLSGLVLILAAATVLHPLVGEVGERGLTVVAGAMLITAHVRNFRLCRKQHDDPELETGSGQTGNKVSSCNPCGNTPQDR